MVRFATAKSLLIFGFRLSNIWGPLRFPSDEAATKLLWLALRNLTAKWKNPPIAWAEAKVQFAIQFGDRFRLDD